MYQSVGLREIFEVVRKELILIILVTFSMTVLGVGIKSILPPVYEAKTDLLVNSTSTKADQKDISASEIDTNLRLIETYKYIMSSSSVMEKAAEKSGLPLTAEKFAKNIKIESSSDSQIISIKAEASTQQQAAKMANLLAETFKTEVKRLMKIENVQILTKANSSEKNDPIKPSMAIYATIFFCIGCSLAILIIFLKETVFIKLDSQEKIEKVFNLPSLGIIPKMKTKKKSNASNDRFDKMLQRLNPYSAITESYRSIRTNLQYTINQNGAKSILFTSSNSGEGKSLTSANLAISMAAARLKTVLVDMDLRQGVGDQLFQGSMRRGVTSYLEGSAKLDEVVFTTDIPNLSFIGTGPLPPAPAELISSDNMDQLLRELKKRFDIVLIDSPPLIVADAVELSTKVDGCVFIIGARKQKLEKIITNLQKLQRVKANIFGVVLNGRKMSKKVHYYY